MKGRIQALLNRWTKELNYVDGLIELKLAVFKVTMLRDEDIGNSQDLAILFNKRTMYVSYIMSAREELERMEV